MTTHAEAAFDEAEVLVSSLLSSTSEGHRKSIYRRLRQIAPVHRTQNPLVKGWFLISGYANCKSALVSSEAAANSKLLQLMNVEVDRPLDRMMKMWMKFLDDVEEHDRVRRLFFPHFTPRAVEAYRDVIRQIVGELLDRLEGRDKFDIVSEFAFPLPSLVISRVLGVPIEDMARFHEVMDNYLRASSVVNVPTEESRNRRDAIAQQFLDLFSDHLERSRRKPANDLVSKLAVSAPEAGISDEMLLAQFAFILVAGHSTTADMIGNSLVALSEHPDQLEELAKGHVEMREAVNEFLRYDSSLEVGSRYFVRSCELGGVTIPAHSKAMLLYHTAHGDPEAFDEPERLILARKSAQPAFPFGSGRYICLGNSLAKIELEEALGALVQRLPRFKIEELQWRGGLVSHGPSKLLISRA